MRQKNAFSGDASRAKVGRINLQLYVIKLKPQQLFFAQASKI